MWLWLNALLPSCTTVPITERKQLSLIPEARINQQASAAYEQFRSKAKLITKGPKLREIKTIGKRMEKSVSAFFQKRVKKIQQRILAGIMFCR